MTDKEVLIFLYIVPMPFILTIVFVGRNRPGGGEREKIK